MDDENKVYCKDCKWAGRFRFLGVPQYCTPKTKDTKCTGYSWYAPRRYKYLTFMCEAQNSDNDCKHFRARGWL